MLIRRLVGVSLLICVALTCVVAEIAVTTSTTWPLVAMIIIDVVVGFIVYRSARGGVPQAQVILLLAAVMAFFAGITFLLSLLGPVFTFGGVGAVATMLFACLIRRREKVVPLGYCEKCSYDLRASFDRCPECGADLPTDLSRRRKIRDKLTAKRLEQAVTRSRMVT